MFAIKITRSQANAVSIQVTFKHLDLYLSFSTEFVFKANFILQGREFSRGYKLMVVTLWKKLLTNEPKEFCKWTCNVTKYSHQSLCYTTIQALL